MTDSTRTDPRFHPAYQRGYSESPLRAAAPRPPAAAVVEPERARPADRAALPDGAPETESPPPVPRRPSALDRRVPIALVALGVLFLVSGLGLLWSATSTMYGGIGVQPAEFDRFVSALTSYLAGPAITIGLLSIGAAIAVRAARP